MHVVCERYIVRSFCLISINSYLPHLYCSKFFNVLKKKNNLHDFVYPILEIIIVILITIVKRTAMIYSEIVQQNEKEVVMIEYSPFWNTLKKSTETTYTLIHKHHISSATIDKLRKNKPVTTTTLNDLCEF